MRAVRIIMKSRGKRNEREKDVAFCACVRADACLDAGGQRLLFPFRLMSYATNQVFL